MNDKTGIIRWPFDNMRVGEEVLIPYGTLGAVTVGKRLTSAKYTCSTKGIILDVSPQSDGYMVKVIARDKPPVAKKAPKGHAHHRTGHSTQNVRRHFWRQAYLAGMAQVPIAQMSVCAGLADEALRQYDAFVKSDFEAGNTEHDSGE